MTARKNILLIAVDDGFAFWRYRTAFGARLQTPHLDRICNSSTLFRSAYCQVPICGPSRASAMSGLSPFETGVFDNYTNVFDVMSPEQFWSFRLRQEGYFCTTAGKIHHGYKPLPPEVHDVLYSHPSRRVHFGPRKDAAFVDFGGKMGGAGTTDPQDDRQYYDFRSSQDALRFFKNYDGDAPFYREVGFHHPHPPFRTPARFKEMYDLDEFIHPDDWAEGFDLSEFTAKYMVENMDASDVDMWKKTVRNYFSAYSHVDKLIGRVWNGLKKSRHADNTIVVFFSDHGYHMGDKGRFRKFTLWEEATRVPLIVHDPSREARVVDDPVALLDLGPTILDYADCRPMQHAVGTSLRPAVSGEVTTPRSVPTFWYGSASVRAGSHRVTVYQDGSSEFHNVDDDMWLTKNLADKSPDFEPAREHLFDVCKRYGVNIIEPGAQTQGVAPYFSVLKGGAMPDGLPTDGAVSVGSLLVADETPGYRKHFATLENDGVIDMPPGMHEVHFASDTNGGVEHFKVHGNDEDNRIIFAGGHTRFTLEVHTGPGNNYVYTSHDRLLAYAGSGTNHITGGIANDTIHGGAGSDTLEGGWGNDLLYGGSGDAVLIAGTGDDTLYSGAGSNVLHAGPGSNLIILDGGTNRVLAGEGDTTLVLKRTGLPQVIEGFSGGQIDLSDWAMMQADLMISKSGKDAVMTCGTERVVFEKMSEKLIKACVQGIDL